MKLKITTFGVAWLVLGILVFVVVLLPLLHTINAAFYAETDVGLSDERSLQTVIDVYLGADYLRYLWNALLLSAVVTALSMAIGIAMALLVGRSDIPAKGVIDMLVLVPLFLSPLTGLISWISLGSGSTGFLNMAFRAVTGSTTTLFDIWSYGGIVWVMVLFFTPFAYLFTLGSLRQMDGSLEEAARMSGASVLKTIFRITLPMSLPAIFAAALLIFILAAEMYTIPGMIGTNIGFTTLPWRIYQDATSYPVRLAHSAASGTVLLWIAIVGLVIQQRITRASERFVTVSGKGYQGTPLRLGAVKIPALIFVIGYILLSVVLPFGTLVVSSLMKYSAATLTPDIWTLKHYHDIWNIPRLQRSITATLMLAVLSGVIVVFVGVMISFAELRRPSFSSKALAFLGVLPVAVPGLVYGIGLLWTYSATPVYGTIWVLLLAYVAKFLPYGVLISRSGIMQIHPDLEHSARMSGASQLQAMRLILMPLMRMTLVSVLFFVMLMSMKEISASLLLSSGRTQVLSVLTWTYMDSGNYQLAAAIGVVQTLLMLALVIGVRALFGVRLESAMSAK